MNDVRTLPDPGPDPALEAEVRDLMSRALADAEPPGGLAGASALGRRLRRRRRLTAAAVTAAAGAAAAVTVAAALAGGTGGTTHAEDPATAPSSTPASMAPLPDDPDRPPSIPRDHWEQLPAEWKTYFAAPAPAWAAVSAAEMRDRLARLLPDDVRIESAELTSDDVAPGEPRDVTGRVRVVLEDATGARGSLEVMLHADAPPPPEPGRITVQDGTGGEAIYDVTGGSGRPGADDGVHRAGEITVVTATALVPGGWVYVSTANTLDEKWGAESPASAPSSLLTRAQVEALAAAGTWVA